MTRTGNIVVLILVVLAAAAGMSAAETLSIEVFDRTISGFQADNNWQTKYIQENFKKATGVDVTFVTVPRAQEVDKMNVLMAAGQAPDLSYVYNDGTFFNYVKSGGLVDLGPIVDKYGINLKKYLGQEHLDLGKLDGKLWAVPAKRVNTAVFSTFIRKDWLDKLGLPLPRNFKEWYAALQAFKTKDPGQLGGKVIPFHIQGLGTDVGNIDWTVHMLVRSFVTKETPEQQATLNIEGRWVEPGYKEGIRMLNKMCNEGLITPDFILDASGKQYDADIMAGRVGSFIHSWDQPYRAAPGYQVELAKAVPGAKLVPVDPFTNWEGRHAKMVYLSNGFYMFVPRFSKNAVAAIKYLEWMASNPAVVKTLENGMLGVQYGDEKNGVPINRIPVDKLPDAQKYQWADYSILVNGYEFFDAERNAEAISLSYPGYEDVAKQAFKIAMTDGTPNWHWTTIIGSQAKYAGVLFAKGQEILAKSVTCKPGEFDAVYDGLVKEYLAAGGQAVIDEKKEAFRLLPH